MRDRADIDNFIAEWALTGGSELANTHSFVNGLCALIGVDPPRGSRDDDRHNDYVFERGVFQKEADGTTSFGRIDAYKRHCFVLEAKQGSDADRLAAQQGEADLDIFGQTAAARFKRGTAKRGTPAWSKAMVEARGQAERYAKALPLDHGWPPFLLVTDVGHCIDVYADFSGTGKAIHPVPRRRPLPHRAGRSARATMSAQRLAHHLDRSAQPRSVEGSRARHPRDCRAPRRTVQTRSKSASRTRPASPIS